MRGRSHNLKGFHFRMPHSVPRGLLRLLILKALESEELTGADFMARLEERSKGHWRPSPGSIYPMLADMEQDGLIETASIDGRSKTYRISKKGREALQEISHEAHHVARKARLGSGFFLSLLPPKKRVKSLTSGIDAMIDMLEQTAREVKTSDKNELVEGIEDTISRLSLLADSLKQGD